MLAAGVGWAETGDRRGVGRAAARFLLLAVSCSSTRCGMRAKIFFFQLRNFFSNREKVFRALRNCQLTDALNLRLILRKSALIAASNCGEKVKGDVTKNSRAQMKIFSRKTKQNRAKNFRHLAFLIGEATTATTREISGAILISIAQRLSLFREEKYENKIAHPEKRKKVIENKQKKIEKIHDDENKNEKSHETYF